LYKGFEIEKEITPEPMDLPVQGALFANPGTSQNQPDTDFYPVHYQYKQKYILTSVKSGLMIIDQHKAHIRILFDKYIAQIQQRKGVSQRVLFPEILEMSSAEAATLPSLLDDLEALFFELSHMGNNSFAVQGVPSEIDNLDSSQLIRSIIEKSMETGSDV